MSDKCANRRTISLGFTGERVPEGQHICYLFRDDSERRQVIAKYLQSGLLTREKALCLVDKMTPDEMLDSLEELGIDARSELAGITVSDAAAAYCPHGEFDGEKVLDTLRDFHLQAVEREKYEGTRVAGEASWCLVEGRADIASLMAYEARVNVLLTTYPITACCQYDTRLFDGSTIMDVLAVHPVMIVRGQLVRNPYYIEPDRFLKEHRDRIAEQDMSVTL